MEKRTFLGITSLSAFFVAAAVAACNQQLPEAAHGDSPSAAPHAQEQGSAPAGSEQARAEHHQHPEPAAAPDPGARKSFDAKPEIGAKAICPVMGGGAFEVTENTPVSEHKGKYYAFCCAGCKPQFDADPDKYL